MNTMLCQSDLHKARGKKTHYQVIFTTCSQNKSYWESCCIHTRIHILCKMLRYGFPGGSDGKESACNTGDLGSIPGLNHKIPWRRAWPPTPVFLPGESPWTEEPGGLQSMGSKRVRHDWVTKHACICWSIPTYTTKQQFFLKIYISISKQKTIDRSPPKC